MRSRIAIGAGVAGTDAGSARHSRESALRRRGIGTPRAKGIPPKWPCDTAGTASRLAARPVGE